MSDKLTLTVRGDRRREDRLEDDSVDGVLCRFGYMLMHDPEAALAAVGS